tara:strand:- start:21577 stop:21792 length:216 start_codon:yes stop_codon:yes gene_type:complete
MATSKVTPKEEKTTITKEEQALIEQARANKQRQKDCSEAILAVLEKYKCDIIVNQNSPIGRPSIMIQLLQG